MAEEPKEENQADRRDDIGYFETYSDPEIRNVVSFRSRLYVVIQSRKFQLAVVCLVILDCLLVILEVLLDLRIVEMHSDKMPAEVLHSMSIFILSLFMVEIMIKLYVFKLDFFRHKWEVFDAIIVIVSFSLDIAFREYYNGVNGIGLLIILRLWRVARILNGIVMSVKKQANRKLEIERNRREKLERQLARFNELCNAQERQIKFLKNLLDENNIEYPSSSELDIIERPHAMPFNEARLSFLPSDAKTESNQDLPQP